MRLLLHALPIGPPISSLVCPLYCLSRLSFPAWIIHLTAHTIFILIPSIYCSDARGSVNAHLIKGKSLSHRLIYNDAGGKWLLVSPKLICVIFHMLLILLMTQRLSSLFPHHRGVHSGLAHLLSLWKDTSLNLPSLNFGQNEHFTILRGLAGFGLRRLHPWPSLGGVSKGV